MTCDEVLALTDEQLVAGVAEKVMGWYREAHNAALGYTDWQDPLISETHHNLHWSPLADWNHAMQVVEAMRAKGWLFVTDDSPMDSGWFLVRFELWEHGRNKSARVEGQFGDQRRAILRAAYMAVTQQSGG